jgi:hypothetical protein
MARRRWLKKIRPGQAWGASPRERRANAAFFNGLVGAFRGVGSLFTLVTKRPHRTRAAAGTPQSRALPAEAPAQGSTLPTRGEVAAIGLAVASLTIAFFVLRANGVFRDEATAPSARSVRAAGPASASADTHDGSTALDAATTARNTPTRAGRSGAHRETTGSAGPATRSVLVRSGARRDAGRSAADGDER